MEELESKHLAEMGLRDPPRPVEGGGYCTVQMGALSQSLWSYKAPSAVEETCVHARTVLVGLRSAAPPSQWTHPVNLE